MRTGAAPAERTSAPAVSTLDHMAYEEAMTALDQDGPLRKPLKEAVYGYWREKRLRTGKPLLRQLQAATSVTDTNPYNVFRCGSYASSNCQVGCMACLLHVLRMGPFCMVAYGRTAGEAGCKFCRASAGLENA